MQLDPAIYTRHLDGLGVSEAARLAVMQQLWAICAAHVDLAWGTTPEQILLGIRQRSASALAARGDRDPLDSGSTISSTFNDAA